MNLFELFVKIGVDDQASGKLSKLSSSLGKGLATAAKIGTAAVGAAATGIAALTTAAVNNYAEYEQLVGGIETLFGTRGAKTVEEYAAAVGKEVKYVSAEFEMLQKAQSVAMDNAANAYKNAGMSANEYMSTISSFAASLKQSTASELEAAEKANLAVVDMADNANKMGTSMEMIQNAYQGFAKQNYTMLDNLKLGYGGTKSEMMRLIKDSGVLGEETKKLTLKNFDQLVSYSDIIDAIHKVQTEMGITGTTALEAGRTISGSVGAMKSAWTNLVTGLADGNADIGQLVDNLVTTIVGDGTESNLGVLGNVMPAVKTALGGVSRLVSELLPKIVQEIPSIINENLPILAEAAISIIQSLVDGISQNQEMLMTTAFETITYLANSLITMLPQIVALGLDLIVSLANGIAESLPELIPTIVDVVLQVVNTITDPSTLSNLLNASIAIIIALSNGLIESLPSLLEQAPVIVQNLVEAIIQNAPKLLQSAAEIVINLVSGIVNGLPKIGETAGKIIATIVSGVQSLWSSIKSVGSNIVSGVWAGIQSGWSTFYYNVKSFFSNIVSSVKGVLGIRSPSRVFRDQIGKQMAAGVGVGFEDEFSHVKDDIDDALKFDDASIGINASIRKVGAGYAAGALGGTSFGDVYINIDGANYDDPQSLAVAVAQELQNMTDRRLAVYA